MHLHTEVVHLFININYINLDLAQIYTHYTVFACIQHFST